MEPICYLRTKDGEPDWAEDCVNISREHVLDGYLDDDDAGRYDAIPLFAGVTTAMVDRFLSWRLPKDFAPDCHISFKLPDPVLNPNPTWPVGTNLLTAEQARAMLEHVLGTQPDEDKPDVLDHLVGDGTPGSGTNLLFEGRPIPPHTTGPASYYPPPVPCPRCNPIGEFNGRADCENCNGIGLVPAETQPCFMCMGHGVVVSGHASAPKMKECSHCHGSGKLPVPYTPADFKAKQQSSEGQENG